MDQVSCNARMSIRMFLADVSSKNSFKSECLLMRLWVFRLARIGLDDLEKLASRDEMSWYRDLILGAGIPVFSLSLSGRKNE